MRLVLLAVALAACHALPPPPILPFHADTANAPEGTVTATLVLGFAGTLFGGGGFGVAVRVERQETERTTLGLELGGGKGSEASREGEGELGHHLIALRAYGRSAPKTHDFVAVTYGAGLSYLSVGHITATVHAGVAVSYVNSYAEPYLAFGLAAALPLRHGEPIGDYSSIPQTALFPAFEERPGHMHASPERGPRIGHVPRAELYYYADAGLLVPISDTGNRASLDFGFANAVREDDAILGAHHRRRSTPGSVEVHVGRSLRHFLPAHVCEVIRDGAPDDAADDDNHARAVAEALYP